MTRRLEFAQTTANIRSFVENLRSKRQQGIDLDANNECPKGRNCGLALTLKHVLDFVIVFWNAIAVIISKVSGLGVCARLG